MTRKQSRKVPFNRINIIAAVSRLTGYREDELELFDVGVGALKAEQMLAKIEKRPETVLRVSAHVAVREGVDCTNRPKSGGLTSWQVMPSLDYERLVCEEVIEDYVADGSHTLLREFEADVCVRALVRAVPLRPIRKWLRNILTSSKIGESVIRHAMQAPGEYVRLLYLDDPESVVEVLMGVGGKTWHKRLSALLLKEAGGIEGFNGHPSNLTPEGFLIKEGDDR